MHGVGLVVQKGFKMWTFKKVCISIVKAMPGCVPIELIAPFWFPGAGLHHTMSFKLDV